MNNAYDVLRGLKSHNAKGDEKPVLPADTEKLNGVSGPFTFMPHELRFPKRLARAGIPRLIDHARQIPRSRRWRVTRKGHAFMSAAVRVATHELPRALAA